MVSLRFSFWGKSAKTFLYNDVLLVGGFLGGVTIVQENMEGTASGFRHLFTKVQRKSLVLKWLEQTTVLLPIYKKKVIIYFTMIAYKISFNHIYLGYLNSILHNLPRAYIKGATGRYA